MKIKFLNNINNFFTKKFFYNDKKILGRWNIEYCDNIINMKIDFSNQDHCGPCGKFLLNEYSIHKPITKN
jgi:hypothetical protein